MVIPTHFHTEYIIDYNYGINGISGMTVKKYRYARDLSGGMMYYVPVDGENQYYQNEYYYRKNIQGDVTHIFDENLNLVAKYEYDAWGNHTVINYTDDNIGDLNPIRYRSYYYDQENGLFYLKSRYYDPDTGRFINADDPSVLDLTSGDINGFNLYAYCGNNPVMRIDETGKAWYDILAWIGVGLVVAAAIVLTAGMAGAVIGGIAGGIIYGAAIGTLALGATGAALGTVGGMIYDGVKGNKFGTSIWTGVKIGFGIGAIAGAAIGGAIGGATATSVTGMTNVSFWSKLGSDGASVAAKAAAQKGMTTIGQTFGGRVLTVAGKILPRFITRVLWASLSKTAASTVAMSSVYFFYGSQALAGTIWLLYEQPELIKRGIEIIKIFFGG
jgi:RHS repeat-associated protein